MKQVRILYTKGTEYITRFVPYCLKQIRLLCSEGAEYITRLVIIFGGTLLPCFIYQGNIPSFIVHWSLKEELQLLLEGCKHIRGIIPFGYYTERATCKMLMLLLKSQVESAFKKLDIRYIRYNLKCVITLMCI